MDGTIIIPFIDEETEAQESYVTWKLNIWIQAVWPKLILLTSKTVFSNLLLHQSSLESLLKPTFLVPAPELLIQ